MHQIFYNLLIWFVYKVLQFFIRAYKTLSPDNRLIQRLPRI